MRNRYCVPRITYQLAGYLSSSNSAQPQPSSSTPTEVHSYSSSDEGESAVPLDSLEWPYDADD